MQSRQSSSTKWKCLARRAVRSATDRIHFDAWTPPRRQDVIWQALVSRFRSVPYDHCSHGSLTADATEPAWIGDLLTVACPCGVVFERWGTPDEADADLLHL